MRKDLFSQEILPFLPSGEKKQSEILQHLFCQEHFAVRNLPSFIDQQFQTPRAWTRSESTKVLLLLCNSELSSLQVSGENIDLVEIFSCCIQVTPVRALPAQPLQPHPRCLFTRKMWKIGERGAVLWEYETWMGNVDWQSLSTQSCLAPCSDPVGWKDQINPNLRHPSGGFSHLLTLFTTGRSCEHVQHH